MERMKRVSLFTAIIVCSFIFLYFFNNCALSWERDELYARSIAIGKNAFLSQDYKRAAKSFRSATFIKPELCSSILLGLSEIANGNDHEAIFHLKIAVKLAHDKNNRELQSQLLRVIAGLHTFNNRFDQAQKYILLSHSV